MRAKNPLCVAIIRAVVGFEKLLKRIIFVGISHGIPNGSKLGAQISTKAYQNAREWHYLDFFSTARFIATHCMARPAITECGAWTFYWFRLASVFPKDGIGIPPFYLSIGNMYFFWLNLTTFELFLMIRFKVLQY